MSRMNDEEYEAIAFIKEQILGWIGNLMRDLDARGYPVSLEEVGTALSLVIDEVAEMDVEHDKSFDDFLRDLNDGRGQE
jgi:hypothetical protein